MKNNKKKDVLSGLHIYKDDHNRNVYYDVFSKHGYIINDIQTYRLCSNRFIIGLVGGALIYTFGMEFWIGILVGLAVYAVMEIKFRSFLKRQSIILNFSPKTKISALEQFAFEDRKKLMLKMVLVYLFAILIVIYPYTLDTFAMSQAILCIVIGIIAFAYALYLSYGLYYQYRKNKKETS